MNIEKLLVRKVDLDRRTIMPLDFSSSAPPPSKSDAIASPALILRDWQPLSTGSRRTVSRLAMLVTAALSSPPVVA
jgi:hypothetical protein